MDSIMSCIETAESEGFYGTGDEARKEVESIKNFVRVAKEIHKWIDNWSPDFTDDQEWEDIEAQWKYALMMIGEVK